MSKITVELTKPQIKAMILAAVAMLAGEEGEGDFLCKAGVLQRGVTAMQRAMEQKERQGK